MIGSVDWQPASRQLRQFGLIGFAAFGVIGAWIDWRHGLLFFDFAPATARSVAIVLWSVAACMGMLAWVAPRALLPIHVLMTLATLPIGLVVSNTVLVLLFFFVLWPVGLAFRVLGRDPLQRASRHRPHSCWRERTPPTSPKRYYHQY